MLLYLIFRHILHLICRCWIHIGSSTSIMVLTSLDTPWTCWLHLQLQPTAQYPVDAWGPCYHSQRERGLRLRHVSLLLVLARSLTLVKGLCLTAYPSWKVAYHAVALAISPSDESDFNADCYWPQPAGHRRWCTISSSSCITHVHDSS